MLPRVSEVLPVYRVKARNVSSTGENKIHDDATARRYINPNNFVWVVVGDAARVRSQLDSLGLPVEVVEPQAPARPTQRPAQ